MAFFQRDDINPSVLRELIEEINELSVQSEDALLQLDHRPDDQELVRSLFRSVHTIKGDLGLVGFSPLIPLIGAAEDLLSLLREGAMTYSPMISDVVLLILDRVTAFLDAFTTDDQVEFDQQLFTQVSSALSAVVEQNAEQRSATIIAVIRLLDPSVVENIDEVPETSRLREDHFLDEFEFSGDDDLTFFRDLMGPVELRSQYWYGRSDRILKMSLILNQLAGNPVDCKQLAVAVYVHDFGMACMPTDLVHKDGVLSDSEILLLRSHVQSSANILQYMDSWQQAKEMVFQHHEAVNGSGYPCGLREKEICTGAKIIAIADTFDAMTHQRGYSSHQKRPVIRAVAEINECAGKTLSREWVDVFNRAVQPVLIAHRANQFLRN